MALPDPGNRLRVEVVYALPEQQDIVPVELPPGALLSDAVAESGLLERYPAIKSGVTPVGIFGKRADWDVALENGDRVELYRPLVADPKEQRRNRVRR